MNSIASVVLAVCPASIVCVAARVPGSVHKYRDCILCIGNTTLIVEPVTILARMDLVVEAVPVVVRCPFPIVPCGSIVQTRMIAGSWVSDDPRVRALGPGCSPRPHMSEGLLHYLSVGGR